MVVSWNTSHMIPFQHSHSTKLFYDNPIFFGPELFHFDDRQGLGEQICWIIGSSILSPYFHTVAKYSDVECLCALCNVQLDIP